MAMFNRERGGTFHQRLHRVVSLLTGFWVITASASASAAGDELIFVPLSTFAELDHAFSPELTASSDTARVLVAPGAYLEEATIADFDRETVDYQEVENQVPVTVTTRDGFENPARRNYASFGEDVKAIKWEFAAVAGYYTAINAPKLLKDPQWPSFQSEGWFGRSTNNVGVDKLAHAYSAYVISELLYGRLKRNTDDAPGIEITAAALASGVMLWTEAFDSIEPTSGWSWEDVTFNTMGAGFSLLRNSVPGLDEKLDFRLMIEPNDDIYTISGKEHFQQQRYFLALKPAGFEAFDNSPLRYLELHLGYHGDDFLLEDRAAGIVPKRHIFVGLGINLRELLFKDSKSTVGKAAGEVLDYFQLPYTAVHTHLTD